MKLHYRKLLVSSLAFPVVVVGILVLATPSLMQSRESAMFAQVHGQSRHMGMLLAQIEALNNQDELQEPIRLAFELLDRQSESLTGLQEATATKSSDGPGGPGLIAALSAIVGMFGTLTSVLFSWRQDMRDARLQLTHLQDANPQAVQQRAAA